MRRDAARNTSAEVAGRRLSPPSTALSGAISSRPSSLGLKMPIHIRWSADRSRSTWSCPGNSPSWLGYVRRYCGEQSSYIEGLFVDERIASIRRSDGHHPVHSGGCQAPLRGGYDYKDGVFRAGQCNVIVALGDVGEGDGPTMVIPGSHKFHFPHPNPGDYAKGDRMDTLEGAILVYLSKGDALLFVDGLMHGGSSRTTTGGERRVTIYRYGPLWGAARCVYEYSPALLDRLTPARRRILQPVPPSRPPQG